jgi:hypothetical protein
MILDSDGTCQEHWLFNPGMLATGIDNPGMLALRIELSGFSQLVPARRGVVTVPAGRLLRCYEVSGWCWPVRRWAGQA